MKRASLARPQLTGLTDTVESIMRPSRGEEAAWQSDHIDGLEPAHRSSEGVLLSGTKLARQTAAALEDIRASDSSESEAESNGTTKIAKKNSISRVLSYAKIGKPIMFVKGLKKCSTHESVILAFAAHGNVLFVQLPYDKKKKRNVGYSYVVFDRHDDARRLLGSASQIDIDGKLLPVSAFKLRTSKQQPATQQSAENFIKKPPVLPAGDRHSDISSRRYRPSLETRDLRASTRDRPVLDCGRSTGAQMFGDQRRGGLPQGRFRPSRGSYLSHALSVEQNHPPGNLYFRCAPWHRI